MKISWLPGELIQTGHVGLTHSPGVQNASRDEDLFALLQAGVHRIVCLQEPFEFQYASFRDESLDDRAAAVESFGMRFTHFPIPDMGVPTVDYAARIVNLIAGELEQDRRVVIHCLAGLGRAGTIAACLLASRGVPPYEAIEQVRDVRVGAIQTREQELFVEQFAAHGNSS